MAATRGPLVFSTELPRTPEIRGIETASSTWKRGAPLVYSSGKFAEASANPRDIVAFANAAATGTTNAEVIAQRAMSEGLILIEISLDKASAPGTIALAQTHVGTAYGITAVSGIWYLDVDKTTAGTNTVLRVERLLDPVGATLGDTATDANSGHARVICSLLGEALAAQTAAS